MRPSRFLCWWHAHRSRYNRRIEFVEFCNETVQLLKLGAFELSKWASNCPELLETNNRDRLPVTIVIIRDNAADSCILHAMESVSGYISISSILIQNLTLYQNESYFPRSLDCSILWVFWVWSLWSQSSSYKTCGNWPSNGTSLFLRTSTRWIAFRTQMSNLNQLKIPRCVKFNVHQPIVEVHGFCDASQRAFGACMYLRTKLGLNDYHSKLLCSKSRVAPLKTVSLPWLGLSAALNQQGRESLELSQCPTYL